MTGSNNWDYIIAGGGLSGLVLALKMQEKLADIKVLIIDKDRKDQDDRTWSYWTKDAETLPDIAHKSWDKFKIFGEREENTFSFDPYRYYTVKGKDFYDFALQKLRPDERFTFVQDRIDALDSDTGTVHTRNHGSFQAQLVFKSYFELGDIPQLDGYNFLYQQFKGWFIETPEARFDLDTVTLMDFRAKSPSKDIRFNYILPFAPNRALVEYTAFTPDLIAEEEMESHLRWYLDEVLQIKDYKVLQTEDNSIPMTDYPFRPHSVGKVVHLGTIAGYVKGSSGYCFTRTFTKVERLAEDLRLGKDPRDNSYASAGHFRLLDSVLLEIMCKNEVSAELIFTKLYTKLPPQTLFRFLDEEANLLEILRVMMVCPSKEKFIGTMTKQTWNAASGRI